MLDQLRKKVAGVVIEDPMDYLGPLEIWLAHELRQRAANEGEQS